MTELEFRQIQENQARASDAVLIATVQASRATKVPPAPAPIRRNKYGVCAPETRTVDGIIFASKAEAEAYCKLRTLQAAGEVTVLERQPVFKFPPGFSYVADFRVTYADGRTVVIDVKGIHTPVFKLKRKCMEFFYPETVLLLWGKSK